MTSTIIHLTNLERYFACSHKSKCQWILLDNWYCRFWKKKIFLSSNLNKLLFLVTSVICKWQSIDFFVLLLLLFFHFTCEEKAKLLCSWWDHIFNVQRFQTVTSDRFNLIRSHFNWVNNKKKEKNYACSVFSFCVAKE